MGSFLKTGYRYWDTDVYVLWSSLKAFADGVNIEIRLGSQFTTRKLYHDYFRLNLG